MLPTQLSHLLQMMALGNLGSEVVSKRSGRAYTEDGTNPEKGEYLAKRTSKQEEVGIELASRRISTSTATSQSSLESSPVLMEGFVKGAVEQNSSDSTGTDSELTSPGETMTATGQPINFGVVVPGVYRSSYPQAVDYPFIEKLNLKTIVTLVQKDFPEGYKTFISDHGIQHHVFDMKGTKKEDIPIKTMKAILRLVLDQRNYPLLVHCNHGKHRTGCVVGIVRKVAGWNVERIVDEYRSYAEPKVREGDVTYIEGFELSSLSNQLVQGINLQLQIRSFLRATVFSLFVMFVWLASGSRLAATKRQVEQQNGI